MSTESTSAEPTYLPPRSIGDETRDLARHAKHYYKTLREEAKIGRVYHDNPYAVIAATAGIGYVLAGGLFTPFTRRVFRMGTRALIIPLAVTQVRQLTQPPHSAD